MGSPPHPANLRHQTIALRIHLTQLGCRCSTGPSLPSPFAVRVPTRTASLQRDGGSAEFPEGRILAKVDGKPPLDRQGIARRREPLRNQDVCTSYGSAIPAFRPHFQASPRSMRRRPGTIALILIGFVLAWHACAIGVGETRVANGWVGVLLRVALQSELPNTDSNSLRPPRAEAPAEMHGPSPEIWAQYGPAGLPENESTQYGSRSFDLKTTPTRTDRPLEPSLQALDSPLRGSDDDGLVQNRTAILVPQQTPAAEAPIQIVAFSDSRFRPTNETWRGMLAVNPLPVDRVRPALIPAPSTPARGFRAI